MELDARVPLYCNIVACEGVIAAIRLRGFRREVRGHAAELRTRGADLACQRHGQVRGKR